MVAAEKVNICNMRVEKDGKGVQGESALSGGREGESAATNIDNLNLYVKSREKVWWSRRQSIRLVAYLLCQSTNLYMEPGREKEEYRRMMNRLKGASSLHNNFDSS